MPPQATFTPAIVVAAALEVVAEHGPAALSARAVATKLRCSTAPIYSTFGSVEELRGAVIEAVRGRLKGYTAKAWTGRPFLNLGTGLVLFARDNPEFFRLLFLTPAVASETVPRVYDDLLEGMGADDRFAAASRDERAVVLEHLWYVAMGMATLAYAGQLASANDAAVSAALLEAGGALIPAAMAKLGRSGAKRC